MKSAKCKIDNKVFQSQRALNQHMLAVHRQESTRRRRPEGRSPTAGWDPAPSRIPSPAGSSITLSGEDRLAVLTIKKGKTVLQSFNINSGMSPRLSTISKAFQRISWLGASFIITPQCSAMTNGGYVSAVIPDPGDNLATASSLSSSQGSQTKKWYEAARVRSPPKPDLLYTSPGLEPRQTDLGRLWLASEGPPSDDVTVVITARWRVRLSVPSVESATNDSFVLSGTLKSYKGNYNMRYYPHCSKDGKDDFSSQVPSHLQEVSGDHYFRVPTFTVEYEAASGGFLSDQMHFLVYRTSDKKCYYSSDGASINSTSWAAKADDQVLVIEGTYCKYVGQGNPCAAVLLAAQPPLQSRALTDSFVCLSRLSPN